MKNTLSMIALCGVSLMTWNAQAQSQYDTFRVSSIQTEHFNFSGGVSYQPVDENNVTAFTANGVTYSTDTFSALIPDNVIYETYWTYHVEGEEPGVSENWYADGSDYLTTGVNGLSLSTGINTTTSQPTFESTFSVASFNSTEAIGDGIPDFFIADISVGLSADILELQDAAGNTVASVSLRTDPQILGTQLH